MGPLNGIALLLLGFVLLWSARLIYGVRSGDSEDVVKRVLLTSGWLLAVGGLVFLLIGVSSFLAPILVLIAVLLTCPGVLLYVDAERRMLLETLALAANRGVSLGEAARAFVQERPISSGPRAAHLAELLEAGASLPNALMISKHSLSNELLLAARLGEQLGDMAPALNLAVRHHREQSAVVRELLMRSFYFAVVVSACVAVQGISFLRTGPTMLRLFDDFGMELPTWIERFLGVASSPMVAVGMLLASGVLFGLLLLLYLSCFVSQFRYEFPLLDRFWRVYDRILVMRALALAIRGDRAVGAILEMLASQYPKRKMSRCLQRAAGRVLGGADLFEALRRERVISSADQAVLYAASKVGNLAWALEERAASQSMRLESFLRFGFYIFFPLLLLVVGVSVMMFALATIIPLIQLISGLS